jgi:hypothetical protein
MIAHTIQVPDEAELLEAAQMAVTQHLTLLTNGIETVLSPMPIPGYRPVIVKVKPQSERLAA